MKKLEYSALVRKKLVAFMMKLFGISGRSQESIDYWGE